MSTFLCSGETEESAKVITTTATTHEPILEKVNESLETSEEKKRFDSQEGEIGYYELKDEDMELVELSASHNLTPNRQPHRELPVDVPDSFVGRFHSILIHILIYF